MSTAYHYFRDGMQLGPVSARQLKQEAAAGRLAPHDLVWAEGFPRWLPAARLKGLFRAPVAEVIPTVQPLAGPAPRSRAVLYLAAGAGLWVLLIAGVVVTALATRRPARPVAEAAAFAAAAKAPPPAVATEVPVAAAAPAPGKEKEKEPERPAPPAAVERPVQPKAPPAGESRRGRSEAKERARRALRAAEAAYQLANALYEAEHRRVALLRSIRVPPGVPRPPIQPVSMQVIQRRELARIALQQARRVYEQTP